MPGKAGKKKGKPSDFQSMKKHAADAAALLKSMSNVNRLMILCSLVDTELSVSDLNELLPLSQSALSQHLAMLREAELVQTRKQAQSVYYSLLGDEATQVIRVLKSIYCPD